MNDPSPFSLTFTMFVLVLGVLQIEQRLAVGGLTIVQAGQVHPPTIGLGSWIWLSSISWETFDFGWFVFLENKRERRKGITVSQRIVVVSRDKRENRKEIQFVYRIRITEL